MFCLFYLLACCLSTASANEQHLIGPYDEPVARSGNQAAIYQRMEGDSVRVVSNFHNLKAAISEGFPKFVFGFLDLFVHYEKAPIAGTVMEKTSSQLNELETCPIIAIQCLIGHENDTDFNDSSDLQPVHVENVQEVEQTSLDSSNDSTLVTSEEYLLSCLEDFGGGITLINQSSNLLKSGLVNCSEMVKKISMLAMFKLKSYGKLFDYVLDNVFTSVLFQSLFAALVVGLFVFWFMKRELKSRDDYIRLLEARLTLVETSQRSSVAINKERNSRIEVNVDKLAHGHKAYAIDLDHVKHSLAVLMVTGQKNLAEFPQLQVLVSDLRKDTERFSRFQSGAEKTLTELDSKFHDGKSLLGKLEAEVSSLHKSSNVLDIEQKSTVHDLGQLITNTSESLINLDEELNAFQDEFVQLKSRMRKIERIKTPSVMSPDENVVGLSKGLDDLEPTVKQLSKDVETGNGSRASLMSDLIYKSKIAQLKIIRQLLARKCQD